MGYMSEIIFEVREDEVDGGYHATALGYGIHTQGDIMDRITGDRHFSFCPQPLSLRLITLFRIGLARADCAVANAGCR
jgi:hypothetical protein